MSKLKHLLGHVGIGALQFVAHYSDIVPGKYKPLALGVGVMAQAVLGLVNHDAKTGQ